jgi:hypothetical protein
MAPAPGAVRAEEARPHGRTIVFGADAFLAGLCHLLGIALKPLPQQSAALFTDQPADRLVLVAGIAAESTALLDERLIAPALRALRQGSLGRLTLIANDTRVTLGRHSGWKRWRRARAGLAAFA